VEPEKRLGSGPIGSALSFAALKRHEFFKGADFQKILKSKPPLSLKLIEKLNADKGERCFCEFALTDETNNYRKAAPEVYSEPSESKENKKRNSSLNIETFSEQQSQIIKEGVVDKKCGWLLYYNRKLKLTSEPRLSYYNPKTNEYKVLQQLAHRVISSCLLKFMLSKLIIEVFM
jgi:hypothetical protein